MVTIKMVAEQLATCGITGDHDAHGSGRAWCSGLAYCARHFWLTDTSCTCWQCECGDVQAVPARDCCGYCSRCCRSAGLCAPRNGLGHYVARVWRDGDGRPRSYELVATGALEDVKFTITREPAGWLLSGAPREVWAHPQAFGFELRLCPGHGGGPCEYGAHDALAYTAGVPLPGPVTVRMADLRPGDVYANASGLRVAKVEPSDHRADAPYFASALFYIDRREQS